MTMTVHCPHCLTGYELPPQLMGAHGARVRCPGCQGVFSVLPEESAAGDGAPSPAGASSRDVPSGAVSPQATEPAAPSATLAVAAREEPVQAAVAVLDVLIDFLGDALVRSRERGTVLSDHGPAIVAVWEEYLRRAGDDAPGAPFRLALKERCGVDLTGAASR
jgi:predicted Zn finger-like uncharacterized protein